MRAINRTFRQVLSHDYDFLKKKSSKIFLEFFFIIGKYYDCFIILQKEVKSRVQYIIDVLCKMDIALEQPVIAPVVEKSRTRSPSPKETRRVRKASSDSDGDRYKEKFQKAQNYKRKVPSPSRDRSEETTKRSKSKKKHKVHNISTCLYLFGTWGHSQNTLTRRSG